MFSTGPHAAYSCVTILDHMRHISTRATTGPHAAYPHEPILDRMWTNSREPELDRRRVN